MFKLTFFFSRQPAGLAKGSVDMGASTEKLDPEDGEEEQPGITSWSEHTWLQANSYLLNNCAVFFFFNNFFHFFTEDKEAKHVSSPAAEALPNGTECDGTRNDIPKHSSETNKTLQLVNENGAVDTEPPHGSVTGSNGLVLTKLPQDGNSAATTVMGVSPHRTNWSPSGSAAGGHTPNHTSGCAQSSGARRTDHGAGNMSGQGAPDTKNCTSLSTASTRATITIHRARKTMSRPAVSPAQKVIHQCGTLSAIQ